MGKFDGCLLVSDIDGTLLSNGELPERNIRAIEYFMAEGGCFALATGRTVGAVSVVTRKINNIGPSITGNGSVIYDFSCREIKHSVFLSEGAKQALKEIKRDYPNMGIEVHSGEKVFVITRSQETDDHEEYEELTATEITVEEMLSLDCNKALVALESKQQQIDFTEYAKKYITDDCDYDFLQTTAKIYGRIRYYCEVVPKGCNKAAALVKLKELLNIPNGRCYAIGDYYNDLEMICAADTSAVTLEAPEELKKKATTVTGSVEDGAVADFIGYIEKQLERERN